MNVGGGQAAEKYDQLFNEGSDLDVYFCEADWALKYINDDSKTLALSKLGLGDSKFTNIYNYTDEIGKDQNGVRKGISWQAAAGGFAYRADLAEEYLGVKSPDEMDAKIGNWENFVAAAKEVSEKSSGGVALADTLGGLWQAFACGRTQPWVVDNKLVIDDFCKNFADTAKELWDCGGVTKNSQWTDEWTAAGVSGNCMGYFVSTWGFGGFFLDAAGGENGAQYGKWAVCQGPTPFYWGGTWIVVNPETDNGEEARDFIISATSDEAQMSAYAKAKPEYVNNSQVMDDLIAGDTVFNPTVSGNFKDGQNYFKKLAENAKSIDFKGLITPYDSTIKGNFADAVKENYLDGNKSWDETVEAFKDKVAESVPDLEWDD
ncbi:ABC transporter substrate-binding protein [Ruminococcus flavefaciens]|nr:ABC transporter substrate-binding protein [Ruminococcus flavefaciens]